MIFKNQSCLRVEFLMRIREMKVASSSFLGFLNNNFIKREFKNLHLKL